MSGFVYILFNKRNGTLFVEVMSNLVKRIYKHKNNLIDGFTKNMVSINLIIMKSMTL